MGGKMAGTEPLVHDVARQTGGSFMLQHFEDLVESWCFAGSIRRGKAIVGDIDIVVEPKDGKQTEFWAKCVELFGSFKNGNPKASGKVLTSTNQYAQLELYVTNGKSYGAMLLFATGSGRWNIMMRGKAKAMNYKLNEKGLWSGTDFIAGGNETEVFEALGMQFTDPAMRRMEGE